MSQYAAHLPSDDSYCTEKIDRLLDDQNAMEKINHHQRSNKSLALETTFHQIFIKKPCT